MGKGKRLHPATKNVSGAADSGESRDGGTRAVSFSDPLRKTESGLDKDMLRRAICSGVGFEPDKEIIEMAVNMVAMCTPGRNAWFLAMGFNVATEYWLGKQAEDEQKRESRSGTVGGEQGVASTERTL